MAGSITIENLRQIDKLIFDVPSAGVYVLSGTNGTGKSSVLACLLRLGWSNAFQISFKTSKISNALDTFASTKITYAINGLSVSYQHSGVRWEPTPKRASSLLKSFGYSSVIYAAANSSRIEPRAEEFLPQRVRDASQTLKDAAKNILDDPKFDQLKVFNVRRGVGAEAFLLPDHKATTTRRKAYFSEKNFSLGELCVLKLLRQLDNCPDNSLVLIDELELALHPRAQIQLFRHLESVAIEKRLTTIFSTHSVSLIKTVDRSNLFFIDRIGDRTELTKNCYATYALGQLALREERTPDIVLYVEDDQAQFIVNAVVNALQNTIFNGPSKPTVVVVPIGPFSAVISFLTRAKSILPDSVRQFALLDKDAYEEYVVPLTKARNHTELAKVQRIQDKLNYLPWTPEVGICEKIMEDIKLAERELRSHFNDNRISIASQDYSSLQGLNGGALRKASKTLVSKIINEISSAVLKAPDRVRQDLSDYFVSALLSKPKDAATLKALFIPLLKA